MSGPRILIAGIGNIFFGDDGFGVEVARRLSGRPPAAGVRVVDFGIRGIDLTYALLDGYDRVILVDAIQRGGEPGSLYVIEPETLPTDGTMQTHEMAPARVLTAARAMGADTSKVLLVGCEPGSFGSDAEPLLGLTDRVAAAVDGALALIDSLVAESLLVSAGGQTG